MGPRCEDLAGLNGILGLLRSSAPGIQGSVPSMTARMKGEEKGLNPFAYYEHCGQG